MTEIIRRSPPTPWDHAPKGTLCRVNKSATHYDIYMQSSPNENIPNWELIDQDKES